ncbi:MAG TPA: T9SS type A sorting domain-containing protein [Flavipsychrobacter sp.]|nr:T9SS type A sorting domain-containing protein [Flavipsychrobacter sp.]
MKKTILFSLSLLILTGISCSAQSAKLVSPYIFGSSPQGTHPYTSDKGAKTTRVYDTLINNNKQLTNTIYDLYVDNVYPLDSGYYLGMNAYNYRGCAESYGVSVTADTSVSIDGALSIWRGNYNFGTKQTLNIQVWGLDTVATEGLDSASFLTGFPSSSQVLASQTVSIANLGINKVPVLDSIYEDSVNVTMFSSPAVTQGPFFLGYEISYNWAAVNGDTITLRSTPINSATGSHKNYFYVNASGDTIYHVRNAVEVYPGTWVDPYWNGYLNVDLSIVPIIHKFNNIEGVRSITKNDLTFFGNYPNPATTSTNIKFSLNHKTDVKVMVMDMNGRVLNTIIQPALTSGEHVITLPTTNMPVGTYIFMISTGEGDAMAEKLDVIK